VIGLRFVSFCEVRGGAPERVCCACAALLSQAMRLPPADVLISVQGLEARTADNGATYAMSPFGELYANSEGVAQERA
jgi:hypothetical protein